MTAPTTSSAPALTYRQIFKTWWPLAFSWLLMSFELPAVSAVIARLANPEINLAAYGGVIFPLALIIESPIIMLLAASTALSKDRASYQRMWRFMMITSALLTVLHLLIAFTPLYYLIVRNLIGAPEEIVEPARIGLMLLTPWTWAIAYRRFNQGVMIRFGYSGAVGAGTITRLVGGALALAVGYNLQVLPGAAVGAIAQSVAVLSEALYVSWRVRPILKYELDRQPPAETLTWRGFADFYIPLALTSLITLLWQPVGSAALSRMPNALQSLAVWPVLSGLTFLLRSGGIAFNEVVVALLGRPNAVPRLRGFMLRLASITTALHLLVAATPLATLYFARVSALPPNLIELAQVGFWLALPMPALAVLQNWYQGNILHARQTRAVPESVIVFFGSVLLVLGAGVLWGQMTGLYVGMTGFVIANFAQMSWLWFRSRSLMVQSSQ